MYKIKKHKSHISGGFKCRPFGRFKKDMQNREWDDWLKDKNMKRKKKRSRHGK